MAPKTAFSPNYRLSLGVQIIAFLFNLLLGVIPGLVLFFCWVEQNCTLFGLEQAVWSGTQDSWGSIPTALKVLWNGSLFLGFGFIHSLLAQKVVQGWIQLRIPPQLIRTLYLCVTGTSLLGVMVLWIPLQEVIWRLNIFPDFASWMAKSFYWGCMLYAGYLLTRLGVLSFFGVKQLTQFTTDIERTEGTPQLIVSGVYRWVRHPVYTLTLMAFLISPEMTLGRLTLFGFTLIYLLIGIPIEERKLTQQFGDSYREYRDLVPALVPFLKVRLRSFNGVLRI